MKYKLPLVLGVIGACLVSCERNDSKTQAAAPEASPAELRRVTETGRAASKALMESLGGQLKGALQNGGPVAAIEVCQKAAMPLTEGAGAAFEGVRLRRTTSKPRNPANAPDELDQAVLENLAQTSPMPEEWIEWQGEVARYYKPLIIQEVCLTCHGDLKSFSPELASALKERYPNDQATGYALGDFRGVIRVEILRQ
ncbi:MAG: DUF3365 domain-containing protein [Verrucomicrobiae bacterium]|nr:DUF3365 domain-containing protein [Verrucomicrobiae bacterium]